MSVLTRLRDAALHVIGKSGNAGWDFGRVPSDNAGLGATRITKPYAQSIWLMAAIRHIAGPIASVDLQFGNPAAVSKRFRQAGQLINDPRLEMFWASPCKGVNGFADFIRETVGWLVLAGESFWILGDDALVPFPEVRETFPPMIMARPDRMRHIVVRGELQGWEYTDGAGQRHWLIPEQVIQIKNWNPYDDWRGLGEYEVAQVAVATDIAAAKFARTIAEANGDQGPYIVAKNGLPTQEQRDQIIASLREKRMLQSQGIIKPVFLVGDISVEDPQIRSADAGFISGRAMTAEEIYVALGVPPSMSTKAASYSIGSASDYFRLILDTCLPASARIAGAIGQVASIHTGRKLTAWFNWDEHQVLQAVRRERLANADSLWAKGMPMSEVSTYLDLGLPRFDGDDVGYLPMGVIAVSELQDPATDPTYNEPTPAADPGVDPVKEALRVLRAGRMTCKKAQDPGEVAHWRTHMAKRQPTVKSYKSAFKRVLMTARAEVLRKIEARQGKAITTKAGAADFKFDLHAFLQQLSIAFRKTSAAALDTAGSQLFDELGKKDPFRYPPERAIQFAKERENKLSNVADEVWSKISTAIQESMDAGDSLAQIADGVRAAFNEIGTGRATTIAMTETAAAYGVARQEAMQQAGVKYKKWLTSGADNVRPAHADANKQIVEVDMAFDVGGEELMHPGDPAGSPGNIINCHCVAISTAEAPSDSEE